MAATALHRSPFEGHVAGAQASATGHVGVRLRAETLPGVLLMASWPAAIADLERALASGLDLLAKAPPGRTGQVVELAQGLLMRTGPCEFMLVCRTGVPTAADLRSQVPAEVGAVTDLGHARCRIRIEGDRCQATLSKLFALDLREANFPVGELRLTGHHHVPCSLHRRAVDRFDMYVLSTYAFDQLATVLDAAREFGVALELGTNSAY
jgi:heterotetrameric sarcosine oxidase gamma subunit